MKVTDRLRGRHASGDRPGPPDAGDQPTGPLHIDAAGEAVIDLRDPARAAQPDAEVTTDMACPNCGGALRVLHLDAVSHLAGMRCTDCGFSFSHRVPR